MTKDEALKPCKTCGGKPVCLVASGDMQFREYVCANALLGKCAASDDKARKKWNEKQSLQGKGERL